MSKIGIIGDKASVAGFLSLGIETFEAKSPEDVKRAIHELAENAYAIIYITERASLMAKETIARYKDLPLPAIIVIPGIDGNMGLGIQQIRQSAKQAIGADILFGED